MREDLVQMAKEQLDYVVEGSEIAKELAQKIQNGESPDDIRQWLSNRSLEYQVEGVLALGDKAQRFLELIDTAKKLSQIQTKQAIDAFLASKQGAVSSKFTLDNYRCVLRKFERQFPVLPQAPEQIEQFLGTYEQRSSARTAYAYLRVFYKFCSKRMGAWDVVQDVQRPKSKPKEPDSLSFDQAKALVGAIQTDEERALVYVYLGQGLRLREALGLNIEDVQEDRLRVRGKTASQFIPLLSEVREALLRLCRNRQPNEPVFISSREKSRGKPISTSYSESLIAKIFERAGISGIKASPHTLRHTFATLLTRAGCDTASCKRLLRHRDFDITSHYIHLTSDDLTNKLVQFSPLGIIFGKLGISGKNVVTLR